MRRDTPNTNNTHDIDPTVTQFAEQTPATAQYFDVVMVSDLTTKSIDLANTVFTSI